MGEQFLPGLTAQQNLCERAKNREERRRGAHRVLNGIRIRELTQQLYGACSNVTVVMGQQRQNGRQAPQPEQLGVQLW